MGIATFVKKIEDWTGDARLYRVDPPIHVDRNWGDGDDESYDTLCVVVSAAVTPDHGPETYLFPADESGEVITWGELDGSQRGILDHDYALNSAGYEVVA